LADLPGGTSLATSTSAARHKSQASAKSLKLERQDVAIAEIDGTDLTQFGANSRKQSGKFFRARFSECSRFVGRLRFFSEAGGGAGVRLDKPKNPILSFY
jgi:hypothetical protein